MFPVIQRPYFYADSDMHDVAIASEFDDHAFPSPMLMEIDPIPSTVPLVFAWGSHKPAQTLEEVHFGRSLGPRKACRSRK